jgi:ABC-type phosphate transport system substrate-binding protein
MPGERRRIPWLLVRVAIYLAAILVLLLLRGQVDWKRMRQRLSNPPVSDGVLTLAGRDVAPELLHSVVDLHRRDYPQLQVDLQAGGSTVALEALLNRRVEVAVSSRPPLRHEQALFAQGRGDTAEWSPFAVSALVLLQSVQAPDEAIGLEQLRDLLSIPAPERTPVVPRLYLVDPNEGSWDGLCAALQLPARDAAGDAVRPARVAFLADAPAVLQALRDDPSGLGVLSALTLPDAAPLPGLRQVAVRGELQTAPVLPTYEDVGGGRYPLFHHVYVATAPPPTDEGTMFITYLVGERGQRQIERGGFLPAERVLRQIHLTTHPLGEHH